MDGNLLLLPFSSLIDVCLNHLLINGMKEVGTLFVLVMTSYCH